MLIVIDASKATIANAYQTDNILESVEVHAAKKDRKTYFVDFHNHYQNIVLRQMKKAKVTFQTKQYNNGHVQQTKVTVPNLKQK